MFFVALLSFHAVHGCPASMLPTATLDTRPSGVVWRMVLSLVQASPSWAVVPNATFSHYYSVSFVSKRSGQSTFAAIIDDPVVLAGTISGVIILPILIALVWDLSRRRTSRLRSVARDLEAPVPTHDVPVLPSLTRVSTIDLQPPSPPENSKSMREMSATLDAVPVSIRPAISPPNRLRAIPPSIAHLPANSHEPSQPPRDARTELSPVIPRRDYSRPSSPLRRTIQPPKRKAGASLRRLPVPPTAPAIPVQQVPSLPNAEKGKTTVPPRRLPPLPTVAPQVPPRPISPLSTANSYSDTISLEIRRLRAELGHFSRLVETTRPSSAASQSSHGTVKQHRLSPMWSDHDSEDLLIALESIELQARSRR
ncbi:hypothetical protein C8J57DRAFT_1713294 [Mycena rebaudengoi]|nr:hypothetical protein C8J57DRAFT_1713294 [Mycena rebaudengoi]